MANQAGGAVNPLTAQDVGQEVYMTIYGHRQLSLFFVKVLDVTEEGFVFKERSYTWNDIKDIDVTRGSFSLSAMAFPGGTPKARIKLADGRVIKIYGRAIERADTKPVVKLFSGESDAFLELISLLEVKTRLRFNSE